MNDWSIGIDLGTTNSAIVGHDGHTMRLFKSREQMDVTPSAVKIGKNGRTIVGRKAFDALQITPEDVAIEFKRLMGTNQRIRFASSGEERTPVELSAEIIKSLKSDAQKFVANEIRTATITIPAAFRALQCEATMNAVKSAGLEDGALLMEPIAASMAFAAENVGLEDSWLVYDFGGGTFDVALVQVIESRMSVVEHSGNNMLGGKNLDSSIIEELIWPMLSSDYSMPTLHDSPEDYVRLTRRLKGPAEELKKELSYSESFELEISDIGVDLTGKEFDMKLVINRNALEKVCEPTIRETIIHCQSVLDNKRIPASSLSRIILIGGPTQMPLVRRMLSEAINCPVDYTIDPMTAVAKGAVLHELSRPKKFDHTKHGSLQKNINDVQLELSYPNVSPDVDPLVIGVISAERDTEEIEISITDKSGIWQSGWIPVVNREFETRIQISKGEVSSFTITARNAVGNEIQCVPNEFSIRHGLEVSAPRLPHTYSMRVDNPNGESELDPIFLKNTPLPCKTTKKYSSNVTLLPKSGEAISVEIYEGEVLDSIESNELLFSIRIDSSEISRPIGEGRDIEINFQINENRILNVTAYVPHLDEEFVNRYVPEDNYLDPLVMYRRTRAELKLLSDRLITYLELTRASDNTPLKIAIEQIRERVFTADLRFSDFTIKDAKFEVDKLRQIYEQTQDLHRQLYALNMKHNIVAGMDMDSAIERFRAEATITKEYISKGNNVDLAREYEQITSIANRCREEENLTGLQRCYDDMFTLRVRASLEFIDTWAYYFNYFKQNKDILKNQQEADRLITRGESLYESGDEDGFKDTVRNLQSLLPDDEAIGKAERAGIRIQ